MAARNGHGRKKVTTRRREFTVVIERGDDGYYFAYVPDLRGCHTQAKSQDKLMERVREAIELCMEVEGDEAPGEFIGVQRVTVEV
jgi:predicted RNase H-like HicB family nuclease